MNQIEDFEGDCTFRVLFFPFRPLSGLERITFFKFSVLHNHLSYFSHPVKNNNW